MASSASSSSGKTLSSFLYNHYVKLASNTCPYTHLSVVGGKYMIDYKVKEKFWKLYCKAVGNGEILNIAERIDENPKTFIPIIIDIDLKRRGEIPVKLYNEGEVKELVDILQKEIDDTFITEHDNRYCFLMEKPPRKVGENIKSGFHLHFPLFVRREAIISNLYPKVIEEMKDKKIFEEFGGSEVLDKGMPTKPQLLYGSRKRDDQNSYLCTRVYAPDGEECKIDEALKNYKLYDTGNEVIPDPINNLPRVFSSFIDNRPCHKLKPVLPKRYVSVDEPVLPKRYVNVDEPEEDDSDSDEACEIEFEDEGKKTETTVTPEKIEEMRGVLAHLSNERLKHNYWLKIGYGLKGYPFELYDDFSKRSLEHYNRDEAFKVFNSEGDPKKKCTVGTIYFYLKQDDPEYFKLIHKKKTIDGSLLKDKLDDVLRELQIKFYEEIKLVETNEKAEEYYNDFEKEAINILNNYLCFINGSSKGYILYREIIHEEILREKGELIDVKFPKYFPKLKGEIIECFGNYSIPEGIKIKFNNEDGSKQVKYSKKKISIISLWIKSINRKTARKETFVSKGIDCFSTFSHIAITPELAEKYGGDISEIQYYLNYYKEHWCQNDEKLFDTIVKRQACYVQRVGVKYPSIIAIKGPEGVLKGGFVAVLSDIIGNEYCYQPSSINEVIGNFNSLMDNTLLDFLDELVWGGDKQNAGTFKKLVSEKKRISNEKYGPIRKVENCFNSIIASNEDWVVPAGSTARRFIIIQSDKWLIDQPREVVDKLVNVNRFTYAKYLYSIDLTGYDPREIVKTAALADQKLRSSTPFEQYMVDKITNEFTFEVEGKEITDFGYKINKVEKQLTGIHKNQLYKDYLLHVKKCPLQQKLFETSWLKWYPKSLSYSRQSGSTNKVWITFPSIKECKIIANEKFNQTIFEIEDEEKNPEINIEEKEINL